MWLAHVLLEHGTDDALADGAGLDARAHADSADETEMHILLTQHRRVRDAQAARDRSGGLDHERNAFLQERRQFLRLHALFYEARCKVPVMCAFVAVAHLWLSLIHI